MWSFACYQFAILGMLEASVEGDEEKNRLCPPISHWDTTRDYLSAFLATLANQQARAAHPALAGWAKDSRLNPLGGIDRQREAPGVAGARERIRQSGPAAAANLAKLLAA
jgi:hypothetical protein